MITERLRSAAPVWAVPLMLMALMVVLEALGEPARLLLRYDRLAIADGQWWRLMTGNLVHLGWYHLMLNEIGIVVLVLLCPDVLSPAVWLRRLLVIGTGMCLCLYGWVPGMGWYVGLSGVMHGLFLLGLGRQAIVDRDRIAMACLLYLFGKLAWEFFAGVPVSDEQAIGGKVALESHMYGALVALFYGIVFGAFWRRETFIPEWGRQ